MDKATLRFKVNGMVQHGGITWSGWPDAIVKALEELKGVLNVEYEIEKEEFQLTCQPQLIQPKQIVGRIVKLGHERKLPYTVTVFV